MMMPFLTNLAIVSGLTAGSIVFACVAVRFANWLDAQERWIKRLAFWSGLILLVVLVAALITYGESA